MAWSNDVVRLQEIDLERIGISVRCTQINQALADDEGVAQAKAALEQIQQQVNAIRKQQETMEFELNRVQSKAQLTQAKLYSGRITNARELQDLQAESESLKRHDAELEDEILGVMMEREDVEQVAATAQQALSKLQNSSAAHHAALSQELANLQAQDQNLANERKTLVEKLPAAIVDTYLYLQPRTGNRPVTVLKGDQCGVCGMEVSPSDAQKAHHGEEAYCGGCRRLLVSPD